MLSSCSSGWPIGFQDYAAAFWQRFRERMRDAQCPGQRGLWRFRDENYLEDHPTASNPGDRVSLQLSRVIQHLLVGGLEHFWHFPINIGNVFIPVDFHIFQRGGPGPPTRYSSIYHFEQLSYGNAANAIDWAPSSYLQLCPGTGASLSWPPPSNAPRARAASVTTCTWWI